MQNFADGHLPMVQDMITVPTAGGAEAFVDAADIAAVAVETLADPGAHAGAVYAPAGPEALTVAEVAGIIASVAGRPVSHNDIEPSAWIDGAIEAGIVPVGYGVMLNWLTATIASGRGSRPNDGQRARPGRVLDPLAGVPIAAPQSWPTTCAASHGSQGRCLLTRR